MAKSKKNAAVAVAAPKTANKAAKAFSPMEVKETVQVSPKQLTLRNWIGRSAPVADEDVLAMAESLHARQDQPIQIRKGENGELEVIFGTTRTRAGLLITEGFKIPVGKDGKTGEVRYKEFAAVPDFTLRAEVVECDDEEATLRNITENVSRVATTAIDDALNQEMLRTDYGMSDAAITRLYGYGHQASVTQLKKLLSLPADFQQQIHTGSMSKQAGFVLVDWCKKSGHVNAEDNVCNQEICDAVFKFAKNEGDSGIGASDIQNAIQAYQKSLATPAVAPDGTPVTNPDGTPAAPATNPDGTPTAAPTNADGTPAAAPTVTTFPKTLKDMKDMLTEFAGLPDQPAKLVEFCSVTLNYLKGEVPKDVYHEWLSDVFAG